MCKRYQLLAILSYIHIVNAASIHVPSSSLFSPSSSSAAEAQASSSSSASTSTSVNPATLLLPSGFDSQLPPRQPMLYPFVVSSSSQPTPSTRKPFGPFISPGWIPISSSNANNMPLFSSSSTSTTTTPQPYAGPILEDRISKYVVEANDNGPVFESIIYGTWKPDPPLQPVEIVNATTTTTTQYSSGNSDDTSSGIRRSDSGNSGIAVDGKVSNKTINRQHGGFIDNKQQKPIQFEKDSYEKSALLEQKSNESIDNLEQKPSIPNKFVKKQGRQKIRPNSTTSTTTTTTTTTMTGTAATHQFPLETTEQSATMRDVIKANINVPVEVVRQINDSIEIKYNHKQTSRHSIEMTAHERYDDHHHHHDDDDDDDVEYQTKEVATASTELQQQEDGDGDEDDDELGNSSVIRMNWPTDFMDIPLSSTTSTEQPSDENDSSSLTTQHSTESDSAELPLALSSLNIPPSLWPKLPGNITKLGSPYAAENSLEEPAICVPITVREFNMMNSNEVVNIERVFCFPMPSGTTTDRELFKSTSTTRSSVSRGRGTISPVVNANIQNYEEYFESHAKNTSSVLKSQLYLLCYVLVFFKFIF